MPRTELGCLQSRFVSLPSVCCFDINFQVCYQVFFRLGIVAIKFEFPIPLNVRLSGKLELTLRMSVLFKKNVTVQRPSISPLPSPLRLVCFFVSALTPPPHTCCVREACDSRGRFSILELELTGLSQDARLAKWCWDLSFSPHDCTVVIL